jgi:tRNA 2-selenouridine synthase
LLLHALARNNCIIDFRRFGNHKGFRSYALHPPQPTQEMFENLLATQLSTASHHPSTTIYLKMKASECGNFANTGCHFLYCMRKAPVYFVDTPFEERLNYLTDEYMFMKTVNASGYKDSVVVKPKKCH